jgi:hypothetical protein
MSMHPCHLVSVSVIGNLGFLALDVWVAHSVNRFERHPEWVPFYFSLAAPVFLLAAAMLWRPLPRTARALGFLVGWTSTIVGVAGMVYHLQSHFFEQETIRNLVYTAPFVAPLAYAGLGMLILLDRMVDSSSLEWVQWVLFLALGGFAGNFVLSLADHAQNGLFNRAEWVPVGVSALGCAFLLMAFSIRAIQRCDARHGGSSLSRSSPASPDSPFISARTSRSTEHSGSGSSTAPRSSRRSSSRISPSSPRSGYGRGRIGIARSADVGFSGGGSGFTAAQRESCQSHAGFCVARPKSWRRTRGNC